MIIRAYEVAPECKDSCFDAYCLPDGCAIYRKNEHLESRTECVIQALTDYDMGLYDSPIKALECVTGMRYTSREIRGCVQDEWSRLYFPLKLWDDETITAKSIYAIADMFFCLGSEWRVESTDETEVYTYTLADTSTDDFKRELAAEYGVRTDNVRLYRFDGWTSTPKYREV